MIAKKTDRIVRRRKKIPPKKLRKKIGWRRWFFIFSVVIFSVSLVYIFFCSELVRILTIKVNGVERVQEDDIELLVQDMLSGIKFACVKNDNYFFINKDQIIEKILEDQRIKNVVITRVFPNEISVNITEYDVVPIWCVSSVLGSCFELNGEGHTVRKIDVNSQLVQNNKHFIVVDHGHESVENNQRVISAEYLEKIQILGEELIYAFNVGIKQPYIIDFRGSGEVRFESDEGWYVLVDLSHELDEVLHVAQLFAKKVELPSVRSDLEYVDLRFPEKMFYKMRDGVEESLKSEEEKEEKKKK
ncbi:MAG: hypothetical protein CR972_02860 [Candidatus Moraniibacteriota bacterium]|nr:MAG: hypothetical protein CR972_02860 [Candidatus Moranbacteria bacterium]